MERRQQRISLTDSTLFGTSSNWANAVRAALAEQAQRSAARSMIGDRMLCAITAAFTRIVSIIRGIDEGTLRDTLNMFTNDTPEPAGAP